MKVMEADVEVSIPHRKTSNIGFWDDRTGKVEVSIPHRKTSNVYWDVHAGEYVMFQFLIGRLVTAKMGQAAVDSLDGFNSS